jgi:predicted N-formylglutamate amidohydrolase
MSFDVAGTIEIKNDGLRQDSTPEELAQILNDVLDDALNELPWVIGFHVKVTAQ